MLMLMTSHSEIQVLRPILQLLEVTLAKADGMRWWGSVLEGEPVINTQKVRTYLDCRGRPHLMICESDCLFQTVHLLPCFAVLPAAAPEQIPQPVRTPLCICHA